jgi:hypothetical protein
MTSLELGRMRPLVALVVFMAFALTIAPECRAASESLAEYVTAIDRAANGPDGERVVLGHISRQLRLPVEDLRRERMQTGLTFGGLLIAHRLAQAAKMPVEQVVTEFKAGQSWEDITRGHQLDVDALRADMKTSREVVEQRSEDKGSSALKTDESHAPPPTAPSTPLFQRKAY